MQSKYYENKELQQININKQLNIFFKKSDY